jgi:uncharacterized membrane protein YcaP (DUF421 family)
MVINDYIKIIISSVAVYIFIVGAIRLFGKKELAQLSVTDLVFILLISNAVQNAMVGSNSSLAGGLVAAGALFIVNFGLKYFLYRFPKIGRLIQGEPVMLIYKGKLKQDNLNKTRISLDELKEAIREHGISLIEDVDLAVLESDGNISILSNNYKSQSVKRRTIKKGIKKQV